MCICMGGVYIDECRCPQNPEKNVGSPEALFRGGYEPPNLDAKSLVHVPLQEHAGSELLSHRSSQDCIISIKIFV